MPAALLAVVGLLVLQEPASRPTALDPAAAIAVATRHLVALQEHYVPERRVPRRGSASAPAPREPGAARPQSAPASAPASKAAPVGEPREWPYEGVYRVASGALPPGYRVGGTAIVCHALLESPGFADDEPRRQAFARGVRFVLDMLEEEPLLQSGFDGTYDVRGWAHTYGLLLLLRARECRALGDLGARAVAMTQRLVTTLEETAIGKLGGWSYSRPRGRDTSPPSPFMTAPTLQALFAARAAGLAVDAKVVDLALASLEKARLESGAFQYATSDRRDGTGINAVPGACARMAACETTLLLAGRGSVERVRGAVTAFFLHWDELEKRHKQPGTHTGPYKIAPYFFHYGHTYVAQAIEMLPAAERPELRDRLYQLYWRTREDDGGWNDRVFARSEGFGTAFAILGLLMPQLPPPARWATGALDVEKGDGR